MKLRPWFIKGEQFHLVLATFEQTFHKQVNLLDILWIDYEMKVWYSATVFTALLAFVMALPEGQLDNEFMDHVLQLYKESNMLRKIGAD